MKCVCVGGGGGGGGGMEVRVNREQRMSKWSRDVRYEMSL